MSGPQGSISDNKVELRLWSILESVERRSEVGVGAGKEGSIKAADSVGLGVAIDPCPRVREPEDGLAEVTSCSCVFRAALLSLVLSEPERVQLVDRVTSALGPRIRHYVVAAAYYWCMSLRVDDAMPECNAYLAMLLTIQDSVRRTPLNA